MQEGQRNGSFRANVPSEHLSTIVLSTLRLLVTQWRLAGFGFALRERGMEV
jgi:hypothetical protein